MSSISVKDGQLTLFNIFHTHGTADQDKLFAQWRGLPPAHTQKGLIAGNFHRSFDGKSVINYAQWESKEDYDAFMAEAGTRVRLNEALSFSHMDSMACEVAYTTDPAPELSVEKSWFTVVIVAKAAPERQPEVLHEMTTDDPGLRELPGYVSHAVYRGISGEHVIKYAQWTDEDSFLAFLVRPQRPSPIESFVDAQLYFSRLEYIRGRS